MLKSDFKELVKFLRRKSFTVVVEKQFAHFTGKNIQGGFHMPSDHCYRYINGRIAADNSKCFDKWSKCPLVMKLPCDYNLLYKHLRFLGSPEGYKHSNSFDYLDNQILPYEMENN